MSKTNRSFQTAANRCYQVDAAVNMSKSEPGFADFFRTPVLHSDPSTLNTQKESMGPSACDFGGRSKAEI